MSRTKVGTIATIIYSGEPFGLTSSEYSMYEDKLNELDQYNPEDVDEKTKWITFRFLDELGYSVLSPRGFEPIPNMNMFEIGTAEGAAEDVKDRIYKESTHFDNSVFSGDLDQALRCLPQKTRQRVKSDVKYSADQRKRNRLEEEAEFLAKAKEGGDIVMAFFGAFVLLVFVIWQLL